MRILKDFKSCVLEVRILQGLQVRFAEVRILKHLVEIRREGRGARWESKGRRAGEATGLPRVG